MAWHQSTSLWIQQFADGLAVLQFDPPSRVARLTRDLQEEIDAALTAVENEPSVRALVIRSLKPGRFLQGLDVHGWKALHAADGVAAWVERGQALWNRLHSFKIPTIAWVQGSCLGAGLELALACDQIVLVDSPETSLGFSELDLGVIPSWGGFATLPRRVGVANSFPLALAGRRLTAREAFGMGLGDRVVETDDPDFAQLLDSARKRDPLKWTRRSWRQRAFEPIRIGRRMLYRGVERLHQKRLPEGLLAATVAFRVLQAFIEDGTTAGQAAARAGVLELTQTPAFANLVRMHELRERAQIAPLRLGFAARQKTVGILGATPLGMHILLDVVRKGGSVVFRESDEMRLGVAILKLVQTLGRDIQAGTLTPQESQRLLSRIHGTVTWKKFETVDLVVDAHDTPAKLTEIASELEANVDAKTPILVASLGGRLTTVAATLQYPRRLVGIAVPEPIGTFSVAEWRRTDATDGILAKTVRQWLGGVGWLPVEIADSPGLLVTRLWASAWNEMVTLLREGASLKFIDEALLRFGMGRPPLEHLDTIGLDRVAKMMEAVREVLEPRIAIDPFWSDVLDRGWTGQGAGKGFYRWRRGKREPNHLLINWLRQEGPRQGVTLPVMSNNDQRRAIQERVVMLMVNEAFRCLDDGVIKSSDDLDLAMMLVDWAPHHGGPIQYARDFGLPAIVAKLRELAVHGERYEPCAGLRGDIRV